MDTKLFVILVLVLALVTVECWPKPQGGRSGGHGRRRTYYNGRKKQAHGLAIKDIINEIKTKKHGGEEKTLEGRGSLSEEDRKINKDKSRKKLHELFEDTIFLKNQGNCGEEGSGSGSWDSEKPRKIRFKKPRFGGGN